jgi:predicted GNAT family acetyltransferase
MRPPLTPPAKSFQATPNMAARPPAGVRVPAFQQTRPGRQPASGAAAVASPARAARVTAPAPARAGTAAAALQQPRVQSGNVPARPATGQAPRTPGSGVAHAPEFTLQAPTRIAGGHQRISMTISGTKHVIGSVDVSSANSGKMHISNLKVEKLYRRQGIASQLMNAAVARARTAGSSGVRLEARPSDAGVSPQTLVSMYQRMGFRSLGKSTNGGQLMERRL